MTFNSIRLILFLSCLVWQTFAKEIDEVSYSNLKLTPLTSLRYPHQGWSASFDFKIKKASSVSKGDHFSLNFPNVYRIKFDDNKMTTNATLQDGSKAFECFAAQQAAYKNQDTIFKCVVIKDLSSYSSLSGSLSFGLSFSSGGSAYQYELQNADKFHSGTMQVSLTDQLSASVDFDSANSTKDIYTIGRSTTFNSLESYYLAMSCPNGYLLGGTQTINYDKQGKGYDLDCSSVQVHLSDQFNDWSLPLKSDHANARVDCSSNTLKVNMNQTKANQKLWINALQGISDGINTIQHEVDLQYSCSNTEKKTTYETQFSTVFDYTIYQATGSGTLSGLTDTPTSVSSSSPTAATITSTTTTGWTGTYNTTYSTGLSTLRGSTGVPTEEIIYHIETPTVIENEKKITTTTTNPWSGSYTTTYSTGSTKWSDSTGPPTQEVIIYVETPKSEILNTTSSFSSSLSTSQNLSTIISTTTRGWTSTYNLTYSTTSSILTGSTGTPLEELVYYLETPKTQSHNTSSKSIRSSPLTTEISKITSTSATGWTGTYNSTYFTDSTGFGNNTGLSTEEIVYYVETPRLATPPSSTSVTPQVNKTSSASQVIFTPQRSFNLNSTTWSPHIITSSTTDLSSAFITTCNCSKSVPVTKWSTSGAQNTISSIPFGERNYSSIVSTTDTQNFTRSPPTSSGPASLTSSVRTSSPQPHSQSSRFLSTPVFSSVSNFTTKPLSPTLSSNFSKSQGVTNSIKVVKSTLSAETFPSSTPHSITSSPISSKPSTETGNIISPSPVATSSSIVSTTNFSATPVTSTPIATTSSVTVSSTRVLSSEQVSSTSNAFTASSSPQTVNSGTSPSVASSTVNSATPQQFSSRASSTTPISPRSNKDSRSQGSPTSSQPTISIVSSSSGNPSKTPSQIPTKSSSPSSSSTVPSAAAISTTPKTSSKSSITHPSSSLSGNHFSLGLSLDQGSISQASTVQTSVPCSISISTVTITTNATVTKHVTASVTHTVTRNASGCLHSAESHHSSLEPYPKSALPDASSSLAPYSAQGLVLERGNSIAALLGVLLFVL